MSRKTLRQVCKGASTQDPVGAIMSRLSSHFATSSKLYVVQLRFHLAIWSSDS